MMVRAVARASSDNVHAGNMAAEVILWRDSTVVWCRTRTTRREKQRMIVELRGRRADDHRNAGEEGVKLSRSGASHIWQLKGARY